MKILNFGSLNIDKVYTVKNIAKEGETVDSLNFIETIGGKGLNQSIAIAKAGGKVFLAGCIGNDGDMLLKALKDNGVDTSLIKISQKPSGHAIIQVNEQGQNCIVLYHGANYDVDIEYIDKVLNHFEENDILILQNEISNIDYIIQKAKQKRLKIYLNPSPINEDLNKYDIGALNGIFLNEYEGAYLSGQQDIKSILNKLAELYPNLEIILTLGAKGAYYHYKEYELFQPAYKVKAIDTTGAGDTFTGYFIAMCQQGKSIQDVMQIATKAAAISVSKQGASVSIPTIDEITTTF